MPLFTLSESTHLERNVHRICIEKSQHRVSEHDKVHGNVPAVENRGTGTMIVTTPTCLYVSMSTRSEMHVSVRYVNAYLITHGCMRSVIMIRVLPPLQNEMDHEGDAKYIRGAVAKTEVVQNVRTRP